MLLECFLDFLVFSADRGCNNDYYELELAHICYYYGYGDGVLFFQGETRIRRARNVSET